MIKKKVKKKLKMGKLELFARRVEHIRHMAVGPRARLEIEIVLKRSGFAHLIKDV
jgi:hypothetical protein